MKDLKNKAVESFMKLIDHSSKMHEGIRGGVLDEFVNTWGNDSVDSVIKRATNLLKKYNYEGEQLDRLIASNYPYNEMEIRQKEIHDTQGALEVSHALLELFDIQDEYEQFPINDLDDIVSKYRAKILINGTIYSYYLDKALDEKMYEILGYVLDSEVDEFSFDETGLLCLYGLLVVRNTWHEIKSVFKTYIENSAECRKIMLAFCLDYYDNTIEGNCKREHSINLKDIPPSSLRQGQCNVIKTLMACIPGGIVGISALLISMSKTDDFESSLSACLVSCAFALLIGWIAGIIVCNNKNAKAESISKGVELENQMEYERWENEVTEMFDDKAKDLDFLSEEAYGYIKTLGNAISALDSYISDKFSFMPEKYIFDIQAVQVFYDYLKDRRADNLKEAVNLYISEKATAEFRNREIMVQREIAAAQEKIAREAERENNLFRKKLAEQKAHNEQMLSNVKEISSVIEKSNQIEEKRNETLAELSNKVSEIEYDLGKLN